jgi:UDP-glucose 4-epimerase
MSDIGQGLPSFFVTGAAGCIGSTLCHQLRSRQHPVVGYDNLSRGRAEHLPPGVRLVHGDIRDTARLREAISTSQPDCVVHLAAMHFIPDCIARPHDTFEVNVDGTRRVLESCRDSSVRSFILASTAAVYVPTDRPCVEDTTPLGPLEVYGESKVAAEQLVGAFHDDTGITASILRIANAIGRNETNAHVVPHIFEALQKSNVIELGNMAPSRDYIDTRDLSAAILAIANEVHGFGVFNVGSGVTHSVTDVVDALGRILGRPITVVQAASRVRTTERMVLALDITKVRRATQWTPRLTLDDSLVDLITAYGLQPAPSRP